MSNLFSNLVSRKNTIPEEKPVSVSEKEEKTETQQKKEQDAEKDFIFEKTFRCPVCDSQFKSKTVKTGRVKLLSTDLDLRPKYLFVDSLKYDAVGCPVCGYAALSRYFEYLTSAQCKLIREKISPNFKGFEKEGDFITYDEAIAKYKVALANTLVKRAKLSEIAYTCLKIGWLYRGKAENLSPDTKDYNEVIKKLEEEEKEFLGNAYKEFTEAFSKETFPICGMDEDTITYLIAALARQTGHLDDSMRWISKVLTSKNANDRTKEKARDLKECVMKEKKEQEEKKVEDNR